MTVRVWSAGSSRNAGPAQRTGYVASVEPTDADWWRSWDSRWRAQRLCKCGQTKTRCDDCGAFYCAATGHLAHACEGDR